MKGRCLSSQEADAIISILDEEEMKLSMNGSSVDMDSLDERCRSVWPNWESRRISPVRASPPKQSSPRESEHISLGSYRAAGGIPSRSERLDADGLKTDVDTLYSRIRGAAKYNIPVHLSDPEIQIERDRVSAWPPRFETGSVWWRQPTYVPTREEVREFDRAELDSLRKENLWLKSELLRIEKRLELETEEQGKLRESLELGKKVRDAHKQKLCKLFE